MRELHLAVDDSFRVVASFIDCAQAARFCLDHSLFHYRFNLKNGRGIAPPSVGGLFIVENLNDH